MLGWEFASFYQKNGYRNHDVICETDHEAMPRLESDRGIA